MTTTKMSTAQEAAWVEYYKQIYASKVPWLDCSNPNVQYQTYGIAIEAAGPLREKRCLDVGCGRGQLSLAVSAMQAGEVVGVDIMAESINPCRERHRHVRWEIGSPEDQAFCQSLGRFDIIFIIEMLQLVDWRKVLDNLWSRVNPGGRIVAIAPNKDNAIVQKVMARFEGNFIPPNPSELIAAVADLPDVETWAYRGMDFQQDQRIVPYATSPWGNSLMKGFESNRMVIVIRKQGTIVEATQA